MIEKTYIIQNLDCANCAAKMEARIQKLPEVGDAQVIFATKQLRVAAEDPNAIRDKMEDICKAIDREVYLEEKPERQDTASQGMSRSEDVAGKKSSFFRQYQEDLIPIIIGLLIFIPGMILHHTLLSGWASLIVFGIGFLILGASVLKEAAYNIVHGQPFDENFLMSVATIAAFCIGEYPEGMGVMLFYRIGELFEHMAVERSRSQIMDAVDMRPETVLLDRGAEPEEIPAGDAVPGDIIIVRPGDRIPLDGIVTEGQSRIDTSPVTGEPVPIAAAPGTELLSGCVNEQGLIKMQVVKPLGESMVTRILDSVENAAAGKPRIDRFITRFARVYTPIVVGLALLLAIVPSLITGNGQYWITTAITFLVISCPCALVISVPLAFFSGIGAGSKKGILFKGGASLEALGQVKAVVLDKTGTLTHGNFRVQRVQAADGFAEDDILRIAAGCEKGSTHPIGVSITEEAKARGLAAASTKDIREWSGHGIMAKADEGQILCGNRRLLEQYDVRIPEGLTEMTGTVVFLAVNGTFAGAISIADTIKVDAKPAIVRLKQSGVVPVMLTGDSKGSAEAVAKAVGIERVFAQLLPEGKLDTLKALRGELGAVMFVGDGINDAPVLAGADVGAAMGSGADAAIEAADVVFMNPFVEAVPEAMTIAKVTGSIAWQNVVFALGIKLLVMILGIAGMANIWAAVFADTGVAMLCILNSLRILMKKF